MTPEETVRIVDAQLRAMQMAQTMVVKVGLPAGETATSRAYTNDGASAAATVLEVGIWHEYGTSRMPMRSFLRGPLQMKASELAQVMGTQFNLVLEQGLPVDTALGRVGLAARNISVGAFRTKGYGEWDDIEQATKDAKGSSTVLIDTGILRNAITWVVE